MPPELDKAAIRTYRYVRASLVAAVLLLGIALVVQIAADRNIQTSISSYYYTPVRSVFVGTLVGASFALIAVLGRPVEDALLNLAGMLMALVAFIPAPTKATAAAPCPQQQKKCIPAEFLPGVDVSVTAALILGLFGLAFAGWTISRKARSDRRWRSFIAAICVWLALGAWFGPTKGWAARQSLYNFGHYTAAITMFALIIAVSVINARYTRTGIAVMGVDVFKIIYRLIAGLMVLALILAGVIWLFVIRPGTDTESPLVFWLEAAVLLLFVSFWIAQTVEFWHRGIPDEALDT